MEFNFEFETVWMTRTVFGGYAEYRQRHESAESMASLSNELAKSSPVIWWNVRKI